MSDFEQKFDRYADLAVKVGVNIQKGQTLVINATLDAADFVRKVAEKAYEAGAKNVHVEWTDETLTRIKYDMAPDEAFKEYPMWKAKGYEELAEQGAAFMSIKPSNPDLLKGVDPQRIADANKAAGEAMKNYRQYVMADKISWCVIAVPSPEWAAKVFPDLPKSEQMPALWDAIFKATRADLEDPVQAWEQHLQTLNEKMEYLNKKRFRKLHFKAPGTDLTIALPEKHIWMSGGSINDEGRRFVANIPTEEVFTAPDKDGVNGVVRSTKPLSYSGNLIDNFELKFENGRVVDFSAETGEEILKRLLETDDGASRLGEVALVPHHSPISQSELIFYNTLFDENASNHIALGQGYAFCIDGGKTMTPEQLEKEGVNQSITHVDFMIGSADMDIDGETADGSLEPVFRKGNWAF